MRNMRNLLTVLIFVCVYSLHAQKSISLDGVNDNVQTNYEGVRGDTNRTFESWIYVPSNAPSRNLVIMDYGRNAVGSRNTFLVNTSRGLSFTSGGTNANMGTSANAVPYNKWVHVAFVLDNGTGYMYVDGIQIATANLSTVNTPVSGTYYNLRLGYRVPGGSNLNFSGKMDEVRIWNEALSVQEIRSWMCKEVNNSHPKYSNLQGYWKMDTLSGTMVKDYSVNSRNGTMMNGPVWVNNGGPVGTASANVYGGSSAYLTHSDGDSLRISSISGSPSGVHVYYREGIPNRTGLPSGILSFDTSRHWGVHIVGGSNPSYKADYYFTQNQHYQTNGLCGVKWLTRNDNSVQNWSNSNAVSGGNVLTLTSQPSKEYILGYETSGSGPVISSPVNQDTTFGCIGDTVVLSTTLNPLFQYQWLVNGQVSVGDSTNTLKTFADGQYRLIQRKGSACIDTSNTLTVLFNNIPNVSLAPFASVCVSEFSIPLQGGLPAGGSYQSPYVSGNDFIVKTAGVGKHKIIYTYQSSVGCGDTASQYIEVMPLPSVSVNVLDTTCIDSGQISLTGGLPIGGVYFVNGVQSTNYNTSTLGLGKHWMKYEFTDSNNCKNADSTQIEIFDLPNLQLVLSKDKFCEYDAAYTPNGHSPRGGSFSGPGISAGIFNPSTAGVGKHGLVYTYREPIAGCVNQISDSVEVFPKPTTPVITANGLVLSASGSGAFQWYDKNGKIIGETNSTYTAFFNGKYKVEVTANGCRSDMSEEFDINYVGLTENVPQRVGVFPNPFNDRIRVQLNTSGDFVKYQLVSMDGRIVLQGDFSSDNSVINTSMVENGSYIFRIEQNGQKTMFPLVKQ